MTPNAQRISTYGFCMIVAAALVGIFAMSIDHFVGYVNTVIVPCQHDSPWQNGKCVCDNTKGVFGGEFCEECQCKHLGICRMSSEGAKDTRWSCRCPNHQKWVGTTCDNCYAQLQNSERCHGKCIPNHYGSQCNTLCYDGSDSDKAAENCSTIRAGGGTCNTCNGHGSCTPSGECQCEAGWFTGRDGQQCSMGCGEDCPSERGICQSIGGQLQCVCYPGYFGESCEQSCGSINDKPCSGHGNCQISAERGLQCICDSHHVGVNCSAKCPGRDIISTPCSGHGSCSLQTSDTAVCTCSGNWDTYDCSCKDEYTCSGRGTCNPDYNGDNDICICDGHFDGNRCQRCEEHWWGSDCQLYCNRYGSDELPQGSINCHGHGVCEIQTSDNVEKMTCKCQSNYETEGNCQHCEADYYPKVNISTQLEHCSIPCARDNECNGKGTCNPSYDGNNFLCECDKNGVYAQFDTLDPSPEIGCSACKPNWYPKGLDIQAERCTRFCAADGETTGDDNIIQFDQDFTLQGDKDAQNICMKYDDTYGVDANCHVCSNNGRCNAEGSCTCNDGVTGSYCEIDCGRDGREVCSGHGRCIRDDLELWFNPNSNNFRCECLPYDPYTSDARQRLVKSGFKVEPPPKANYYGKHCDYHCPTYNSEICAGRGTCDTVVALSAFGIEKKCRTDQECTNATLSDNVTPDTELADAFCSVMSTPWDSLTPNYFEIGTESPGYTQCTKAGASCIDTIYSVDWANFCVQMLNGWYPNELNTRDCAFDPHYRNLTEQFFVDEYRNSSKTWCENVLEELTPAKSNQCTPASYPGDGQTFIDATVLCNDLTLQSACSNDNRCIYDQTLGYIVTTDENCAQLPTGDCVGPCGTDSNGVCSTKTYCRAKTCADAINEKSIETLCFDLDQPCTADIDTDNICSNGLSSLRLSADNMELEVSAADLFFTCHMYQNRINPLKIDTSIPGNIAIDGTISVLGRTVPVQEYRTETLRGRTVNQACDLFNWDNSTQFCEKHLDAVLTHKDWYRPEQDNWYAPWRVKCGEYSTLWKTETNAKKHRTTLQTQTNLDCTIMNIGSNPSEYNPWALECINSRETDISYNFRDTLFPKPYANNGCTLIENQINARWGQTQWSHDEIEQVFQQTCLKYSESPAIPTIPNVPDYCTTYNPCGINTVCTVCATGDCVMCKHSTIISPSCNDTEITCNSGECISNGMPSNTYKCKYDDRRILTFQNTTRPIVLTNEKYKRINWLKHCSDVKSTFLELGQLQALKAPWESSQARRISQDLVQFVSATITVAQETVVVIQTESESILRVNCQNVEEKFYTNATNTITIDNECEFEAYGVYIVSSITVNGTESLLGMQATFASGMADPVELPTYLKIGYHPVDQTWGHERFVTFHKKNFVQDNIAGSDQSGLQWTFEEEYENIRVSGWLFLSSDTKGEMRLLSNEKALLQMRISSDSSGSSSSLQIGNSYEAEEDYNEKLTAQEGISWCNTNIKNEWIPWYIDVRYKSESHAVIDEVQHHHQHWEGTVSAGGCTLTKQLNHSSRSRLRQTLGRISHSFHNIAAVSKVDCHKHCDAHVNCLQWSWTEDDQHCYLYEKRCHEDEDCVHGTHTLHSSHGHRVQTFVIDTDSSKPVTWAHVRQDQVVSTDPVVFQEFQEFGQLSGYTPYHPDVTAVCNDLASAFVLMPGYETRVCNGESCPSVYVKDDMSMCGEYIEYKYPSIEGRDCSNFLGLNWTAYCHYQESFVPTNVIDDDAYYFPILGATTNATNMEQICTSSQQIEDDANAVCPNIGLPWFTQCLGRWDVYEDFCDSTCLNYIEKQLSSSSEDNGLCEKRKGYLNLNISGNVTQDERCSQNVENLIVTDFCKLQNAYHEEDSVLIPDLYMSDCPQECTTMLSDVFNRDKWRGWCENLSEGEVLGVCSRTSCDCNVQDYIGVDGTYCELTCPSGTENGVELACSGKNGKCFAADFTQISADYLAQEAAVSYRGRSVLDKVLPLPDYEPIWLAGPTPSTTGICQCALGSGDSCSIPCDRCNNGTYGQDMASQYGICDAYFGICRTLPPFMRYNVKYTGIKGYDGDIGSILSYNTTNFEGIEWQNPERFVYATDKILFEESVKDIYDYSGLSYGIQQELNYRQTSVGFTRTDTIYKALEIFQKICGTSQQWSITTPYVVGIDVKEFNKQNNQEMTNVGVLLQENTNTILHTYAIPSFPPQCTKIQMSSWFLCFANGQLHGTANSSQILVIETGNEKLPQSAMTFARVSDTKLYAFGGRSEYEFGTPVNHNTLYTIKIRQQQWGNHKIVLADWSVVETVGQPPPEQSWAPILYSYNELYLLSTVNKVHTMFVLEFTLDNTLPQWNSTYGPTTHNGPLTNMKQSEENAKALLIYIGNEVEGFTKVNGFYIVKQPPPPPTSIDSLFSGTGSGESIQCSVKYSNSNPQSRWQMTLGGNVMAEFESTPLKVFLFLEEWLNVDTTSNSDIVRRFYNTIEWTVANTLNVQAILDDINIDSVMTHVERMYMQQARWTQSKMLFKKIALYQQFQSTDVKDMHMVDAHGVPSNIFLNTVRQNDGSIFENEFVTAVPSGGNTLLYAGVEGDLYSRAIVLSGHFREFDIAKVQFPYTEELKFQTGIMEVVVNDWNRNRLSITLRMADSSYSDISWVDYSGCRTFYLVIRVEELMYEQLAEPQNWKTVFNLAVSKYSAPTYRMKKQTNKYLAYYGSHCSESADTQCPGTLAHTHVPCSGHGRCNAICNCECEVAPSVLQHNPDALDNIDFRDSPYRGDGCEITCPGFDGYDLNSICTNNPSACQRDGTCACDPGRIGDACQFECPFTMEDGKEIPCSNNGGCGTKAIEKNSSTFTRDQYNNRLVAINQQHYVDSLKEYYSGDCEMGNYQQVQGIFDTRIVQFLKSDDDQEKSYALFASAVDECSKNNLNLKTDLTQFETHLHLEGYCVGIVSNIGRFYPVQLRKHSSIYPKEMTTCNEIFQCTYSDCVLARHKDDKHTLLNIETLVDPPKFEIRGMYQHGVSSGEIIYAINGMKLTITIEWTPLKILIKMYEHFVYNQEFEIINESGEYQYFSIVLGNGNVKVKLYHSHHFTLSQLQSEVLWLAPAYGTKYRMANIEQGGYVFNIISQDTDEEIPLLHLEAAEYACDKEEDCTGIVRWRELTRKTMYSLYTFKTAVGQNRLYPLDNQPFDFYNKMSLFYKGNEGMDTSCLPIEARQSHYPMVSFDTTYDIPVSHVDISSAIDEETGAIEIGNGIWTNCWDRMTTGTKQDCLNKCQQQQWHGFAWADANNIRDDAVCLCYRIKSTDIKLHKFYSDTSKTEFNPCDTMTRNNPQTSWQTIP